MRSEQLTMPADRRNSFVVAGLALALLGVVPTEAGDYSPTPLTKSIADHPIVLVGKVVASVNKKVVLRPVITIKGRQQASYTLPAVWRPGHELVFTPVRMAVGKEYLLLLGIDQAGHPVLSKDFAADGVVPVQSTRAPIVRATVIIHTLLGQQDDAAARRKTLDAAWKSESDETLSRILQEFLQAGPDEAGVPFLVLAMDAGAARSPLMESAALVIQRHGYRSAIPGVLKTLEKHDWACIYPATTLGKLKAKDAFEPIMKLIQDEKVGNRKYFIQALCYLQDKRSTSFLVKTLEDFLNERRLLDSDWAQPLASTLEIPNRRLQLLAIETLGRIGVRAHVALPKIRKLRQSRIEDDEFRQVADTAIRSIDPSG